MTETTTYASLIQAYGSDPGPGTLATLRDAIRSAPGFDPDLAVDAVIGLIEAGRHAGVVAAVRALMPGALLSPFLHAALADALTRTGRPEPAAREAAIARLALRSSTDSGDGSPERPWSVLRVSDEYDLLRAQGRTSRQQSLVEVGGLMLDRHVCDDDTLAHFDATALWGR